MLESLLCCAGTLANNAIQKPFVCSEPGCGKSYARQDHLNRHLNTHSAVKAFQCSHQGCNKSFGTRQHLTRHMKLHENPRPFVCTEDGCSESFSKHNQLNRHIAVVHLHQKPYICTMPKDNKNGADGEPCGAGFDYPSQLRKHIASRHLERKRYFCTIEGCTLPPGEGFVYHRELQAHLSQCHPGHSLRQRNAPSSSRGTVLDMGRIDNGLFVCQLCSRKLKTETGLKEHMATHNPCRDLFHCTMGDPPCTATFTLVWHDASLLLSSVIQ